MAPIVDQILSFFATPQGNVIVFLVLVLFSFGAFQACVYAGGKQESQAKARMRKGLISLLIAQVLLFLAGWMAWLGVIEEHAYLPVLDRVVALFSLVLIIWLWAFPKRSPLADKIVLLVEGVIVIAGAISLIWWYMQETTQYFNASALGAYAYYLGIALLIAGVILLLWLRPKSWGIGVTMLVIFLGGYLAQFIIRQPAGDYAWLVRLGEMFAFVLLLEIPKPLLTGGDEPQVFEIKAQESQRPSQESALVIRAMMDLSQEKSTLQYYQKLTQLLARIFSANSCLLLMPPKTGTQLIVLAGYSLSEEAPMDGFTLDGKKMPLVLEALKTGKIQCIDGSQVDSEAHVLTGEINEHQTGHLLLVPLKQQNSNQNMGILVMARSSQPLWNDKEGIHLQEICNELTTLFPMPSEKTTQVEAGREGEQAADTSLDETSQVTEAFTPSENEDKLVSPALGAAMGLAAAVTWNADAKSMQETIQQLENRNRELELMVAKGRPSLEEVEQLREELRAALIDLARVPSTLSKSDQKMLELQLSTMKRLEATGQTEMVSSIIQEFRQPLSSILGYTDLLLGETIGLPGAEQRKFLERVKASTERLSILVNDLIEVLAIDRGSLDQTTDKIDLVALINGVVENMNAQTSEKKISFRMDLPEKPLEIRIDPEALHQIVANLLENAWLVTPEEGEISLCAGVEEKDSHPSFLRIAVTDQGGGIQQADLQSVFTRRYKMEHPLIQGIGDTGVGLSIVKSLVELHKGRVWIDTQEGLGSTFSVLMPLVEDQPETVNLPNP